MHSRISSECDITLEVYRPTKYLSVFYMHSIEMDEPEPSVSTTIPVSIEDFQDVVMQLKNELGLLKTEMDSLKVLTEVVDALKSDYETDIKILRQDLDEERTKVTDLRIELELLRGKAKGLQ